MHPTADPRLAKAWDKLNDAGINDVIKKDPDWLKRINDWDNNGVSVAPDPSDKKLKLFSSNGGSKVAEVTPDGKLLPEKYDYPASATGTPVGQPKNGYQVYKNGDDVSVRRVPDKAGYSQSELTELTQHPNAHVLERHGHDVTDEALIKRANTGTAPDGSRTASGNPPSHSSKFDSPDKLKKAFSNTKPGTTAWNNGIQKGNRRYVTYTSNTGNMGKGVPANGSTFETTNKVLAIYEDLGGGNYQLLTMYPDF